MAIQNITEEWLGRSGGDDINSTEHQRKFRVVYDDADLPEVRPFIALYGGADLQGKKIPAGFEQHPYNPFLCVIRRRYEPLSPHIYDFIIDYSNRANSCVESARELLINPCDAPWGIEYFTEEISVRVDFDENGKPIKNVVGDPPDPNLQEIFTFEGVRIQRNLPDWDHRLMATYANPVNSDFFWGHEPGTVLCKRTGARRMRQGNVFFYDSLVELLFSPFITVQAPWGKDVIGGWGTRIRHEGYRINVNINGVTKIRRAQVDPANDGIDSYNDKWDPTPEPVMLNDLGYRLLVDNFCCWLIFDLHKKLPFKALGLGQGP
jgi:hypothetical protein